MQIAGDNAGLLMGKDLSVQLETIICAITLNYINCLLSFVHQVLSQIQDFHLK